MSQWSDQMSTLSRLQGTILKTATGDRANVAGKLWLGIKIGGSHETLAADIPDNFIFGLDFLMAHGCTVDAGCVSEKKKPLFISPELDN